MTIQPRECIEAHKKAFESWNEGNVSDAWLDADNNICIRYESGKWWHYKEENGEIIWW